MAAFFTGGMAYRILGFISNPLEVLNNSLGLLVLIELENLAAIVIFNYMQSNYNILTENANFMRVKSSSKIE